MPGQYPGLISILFSLVERMHFYLLSMYASLFFLPFKEYI